MSASPPPIGSIFWTDLTVPSPEPVRSFYEAVVGWTTTPLDMGGYSDYCMNEAAAGRTVAGICHACGENAALPAQWLIYIAVADLEASMRLCAELGGKVLDG